MTDYLIAYESPNPDDGKFHRVSVKVNRPRATVFARTGYWNPKRGQTSEIAPSPAPVVAAEVQHALEALADALRPNADEPTESRRRVVMPAAPAVPSRPLLAAPPLRLMHGRIAAETSTRRGFNRTDTILVRAATNGEAEVSARLLNHTGQPLTTLPVTRTADGCELTLALGSLAAADYVIEIAARTQEQIAKQFVAFRLAAR